MLQGLPASALSEIAQELNPRLSFDFARRLPPEISLRILSFLDPVSLVQVTRSCRGWHNLALDSTLWERLYHLEGWNVIRSEIETWEARVNVGLTDSIGHLHRIQNEEGRASKVRALAHEDTDVSMADVHGGSSIFGSPEASFSSNLTAATSLNEMEVDATPTRPATDGIGRSMSRGKKRERSETSLPPVLPPHDPRLVRRSTLWQWDSSHSRYRINWKYLYNLRMRLEHNWNVCAATTFQLPHPNYPEEGHMECVYSLQFDSKYLVSGSRDKTLRIWNLRTRRLIGRPLFGHRGSVLCLQFDADPAEDIIVSGSSDSNIIIWKFSTGEKIQTIEKAHTESVLNLRFDHRVLVTSSKDRTIKIFNRKPLHFGEVGYREGFAFQAAKQVKRYGYEPDLSNELPVRPPWTMIGSLKGHSAAVNAIQVRDNTVVSVSGDRHIKIWDWPEQVCTRTIPAHEKGIACVEYDGRRIVSGSSDFEVCIFDAPTGLQVAQLRGHEHLVRTVQAGFGDLPYSKVEDELEARRVDRDYFDAVEAGRVDHNGGERHGRRARAVNAGSSRPADLQVYGAKLPPGGGGSRKFGRIVSGSYDHSVIIWKRDKDGIWLPKHKLKQEEAAAAARADAEAEGGCPEGDKKSSTTSDPVSPERVELPMPNVHDSQPHLSSVVYTALIDQVVPSGPAALRAALTNYSGIFTYYDYLRTAIDQEPSSLVRARLRQVVSDALLTIRNRQSSTSSVRATIGSSSSYDPNATTSPRTVRSIQTFAEPAPMQSPAPQPTGQPPADAAQAQAHAAAASTGAAEAVRETARIFKLQFDACKIVCCSQAPVIVGWDFCNGDPELEKVARFFATLK